MKKNKKKETLSKNTILYLIGFAILLFGLVGILINNQITNNRTKAIAQISEVENKNIILSNGKEQNKTIYHIGYTTLDGELIEYAREKETFENFKENDMIFVYYLTNSPENVIEKTNSINIFTIFIVLGAGIVLTNLSFMIYEKEHERKEQIKHNLASKENLSFKIDDTMMQDIQKDVEMKEAALIDDDIDQINEEYKNKSLLEKHLLNSSKVGTAYDANGNPINLQNNQLNTGAVIDNNVPRYGNNQVYGQNQGNYYGNNYYGNSSYNMQNNPNHNGNRY